MPHTPALAFFYRGRAVVDASGWAKLLPDNGKRIEKIAIFAIEITNRNSDGHNRIS